MNIPKAIEILDLNIREAGKKMPTDTLAALKLSVEAMKTIESSRKYNLPVPLSQLPGEDIG